MKKIIRTVFIGAALLGAVSCSDKFFEQYPANTITEGNHYQTDDDFDQAVKCCYLKIKTQMGFFLNELAFRSDECGLEAMAVSTQDRYDLDHFQEASNNGILTDVWNAWYNGVYRCNDILDHMEGKELANGDKYRGEVLFLRAWWYFNLYRVFGGVPVTTKVVSPAEAKTIARCSDEQMYDRLTEDLTAAVELLPEKRSAEKARVTKIAAQGLLAKVYLTFGKYEEAQAILDKALEDTNFGMMPTTGDAFSVTNKMNKEILFAIYYNKATDNGHGFWYSAKTSVLADIENPKAQFKGIYTDTDNRLPLINSYTKISNTVFAMNKWYDEYDATYTTIVGNDFPILRYADLYLMYAEALGQQGKIADALPYLNKTRTRAGLSELTSAEISSKSAFIQALADERGKEFALEGQRWFDLVRLGLAVDYFKSLGYTLDSHNLLFPIPQNQIEIVNNESILWQNPGF